MAAYTINTADAGKGTRFLESLAITNQSGAYSKTRVVKVPGWAKYLSVYAFIDAQGGTTPTFDLTLFIPDFGSSSKFSAPTDDNVQNLAALTQVTGAGPYQQVIDIGPGVTGVADDTTGAAAADAREEYNMILPPWVGYTIALDGGAADEDYTIRLVFVFRP